MSERIYRAAVIAIVAGVVFALGAAVAGFVFIWMMSQMFRT